MTAEERLAEISENDRRRQARRREALREKGLSQQNVWLDPTMRQTIDQAIQSGRFSSRNDAINWALKAAFQGNAA